MPYVISVRTDVVHACKDVSVVISGVADKKVAIREREIAINIQGTQDCPTCAERYECAGVVVIYSFEDSAPLRVRRDAVNP